MFATELEVGTKFEHKLAKEVLEVVQLENGCKMFKRVDSEELYAFILDNDFIRLKGDD